ncbi:MAG: hypothetical protein ACFBSD_15635 [Paracoccaceae bacterium]
MSGAVGAAMGAVGGTLAERATTCAGAARAVLDARLIAAHAAADLVRLVGLYREAAEDATATGDEAAAGFFFTQAYVLALDAGLPEADVFHAELCASGREE